ncbi:alpha/beta hydrolase [Microbacterium sp. NC79]|uniref:alpha/beta hydrolase n=1 Tax=Microbacterium sp. NC79 TaxID=2851009 RepID=UPI001C2C9AEB|nr:alpha/beta hydrolase [Microbacterium sp. NC79]MBV0893711.1 alpha/beta hydrolase [Microbacterium sp. NC79]
MNETQQMLAVLNEGFPNLTAMSPLDARAAVDARVVPATNIDAVSHTEDVTIGSDLLVRVYYPHQVADGTAVVVFAHGGGYLHGSIASHDRFCREWSAEMQSIVVSVQYRLAPEVTALESIDDVITSARWAAQQWPERGVILAGDSAGGGIAASATLQLRDQGNSPVVGQVLFYPMLDPLMESDTYRTNAEGYFVTAELLAYYWEQTIGTRPELREDARVNALRGEHHEVPPTLIVTAGLDPLAGEGAALASALASAGTRVTLRTYPDLFHGFITYATFGPAVSARRILWADLNNFFGAQEAHS